MFAPVTSGVNAGVNFGLFSFGKVDMVNDLKLYKPISTA